MWPADISKGNPGMEVRPLPSAAMHGDEAGGLRFAQPHQMTGEMADAR